MKTENSSAPSLNIPNFGPPAGADRKYVYPCPSTMPKTPPKGTK